MFKTGDVVRLKGTNMKMTVDSIDVNYVNVVWFDREDDVNRFAFIMYNLELA